LPRTRAESIDAILEQLGCDLSARPDIELAIENSFRNYRDLDPLFARMRTRARDDDARRLAWLITELENALRVTDPELVAYLLTPPQSRIITAPVPDAAERAAERSAYEEAVLRPLRQMRLDCERLVGEAVEKQPGPEFDRAQRHCATSAYLLMQRFSRRAITGWLEGPFIQTAMLLYEALTGREEAPNLWRHCHWVLDHPPVAIEPAR
jgi:hypothetical protein